MTVPRFIVLTNLDNTDIYVNISLVVCITKSSVGSRITMVSSYYMEVKETPVDIQAKF